MFIFDTCYFIAMKLMYATVEWRISFFFIQINLERRMNKRFTYIFDGINNFDFACWSRSEANYLLLFLRWNFSFFFFYFYTFEWRSTPQNWIQNLIFFSSRIHEQMMSKSNSDFQFNLHNFLHNANVELINFGSTCILFIIIIKTAEKNRSFMKADTNKKLKTKK